MLGGADARDRLRREASFCDAGMDDNVEEEQEEEQEQEQEEKERKRAAAGDGERDRRLR